LVEPEKGAGRIDGKKKAKRGAQLTCTKGTEKGERIGRKVSRGGDILQDREKKKGSKCH